MPHWITYVIPSTKSETKITSELIERTVKEKDTIRNEFLLWWRINKNGYI